MGVRGLANRHITFIMTKKALFAVYFAYLEYTWRIKELVENVMWGVEGRLVKNIQNTVIWEVRV